LSATSTLGVVASGLVAAAVLGAPHGSSAHPSSLPHDLFIVYSANAPRAAPVLFERSLTERDYVRTESLPEDVRVARKQRYVLPTTLRERWRGLPGVRHWVRRGCGAGTPGTIVYDPERRALTPAGEQRAFVPSVRRAARLVASTGCHSFGLAPGSAYLFGLDPTTCTVDLEEGFSSEIPWRSIDIIDVQAQRLLGDRCVSRGGLERYVSVVSSIASTARRHNPSIRVVSQVSFRDNAPTNMRAGIASVANVVDGIYFSYPSINGAIPCTYCAFTNLRELLDFFHPRGVIR
jgi:hypothetical protein